MTDVNGFHGGGSVVPIAFNAGTRDTFTNQADINEEEERRGSGPLLSPCGFIYLTSTRETTTKIKERKIDAGERREREASASLASL
jgi:hypothetical protein